MLIKKWLIDCQLTYRKSALESSIYWNLCTIDQEEEDEEVAQLHALHSNLCTINDTIIINTAKKNKKNHSAVKANLQLETEMIATPNKEVMEFQLLRFRVSVAGFRPATASAGQLGESPFRGPLHSIGRCHSYQTRYIIFSLLSLPWCRCGITEVPVSNGSTV